MYFRVYKGGSSFMYKLLCRVHTIQMFFVCDFCTHSFRSEQGLLDVFESDLRLNQVLNMFLNRIQATLNFMFKLAVSKVFGVCFYMD